MYKHLPEKQQLNLKKHLTKIHPNRTLLIVLSFAIIGVIYLIASHAATASISIEPETGVGANAILDGSASGGKYILFSSAAQPPAGTPTLRVGTSTGTNIDKFTDGSGNIVQPRGVNRPGMEYQCTGGPHNAFISSGNFLTANDPPQNHDPSLNDPALNLSYADTVTQALLSWDAAGKTKHAINTVRIPLNEECWLGINGTNPLYSGANYQAFVKKLVDNLSSMGMNVVLDNHWSESGNRLPGKDMTSGQSINGQNVGPSDHALAFWASIASKFKNYHNIMWDLFTEPNMHCTYGGTCPASVAPAQYWSYNPNKYNEGDDWAWTIYRDGGDYKYTYNHHEYHIVNASGVDTNLGLSSGFVDNGSCIGWGGIVPTQFISVACDGRAYNLNHCALDYSTGTAKAVAGSVNCVWEKDLGDGDGDNFNSRAAAGVTFHTPGLQNIVNTIRTAGSMSPVAIETLGGGSGYIDQMASHLPKDPVAKTNLGSEQVVASTHSYDFGGKKTGTSADNAAYDADLAQGRNGGPNFEYGTTWAVNGHYPFYLGEFGEAMDAGAPNGDSYYTCPVGGNTFESGGSLGNFTESTMNWLDLHKYAGTAWGWDQQEGCHGPSLVLRGDNDSVKGNDTGAVSAYGAKVKAHLQAQQGNN